MNIGLIDYGMGNLHSVEQSFKRLDISLTRFKSPEKMHKFDALILPGVGSFDPAIKNLEKTTLVPYLLDWVKSEKPLLGICLGLQLLFDYSEEGTNKGLGLFKGKVKKIPHFKDEKIPHMGWGKLKSERNCPLIADENKHQWVYFVHSYSAIVSEEKDLAASVPYGNTKLTAIVWKNNVGACQFHPEKSGKTGHLILSQWVKWLKNQ